MKLVISVNREYLLVEQTKLNTKRAPVQASELEMNISNSKLLMRAFCSDLDSDFASEITQREPLRVISSYGATTSICARNLITFPVFPRVQIDLPTNQSWTDQYKSKLSSSNYLIAPG